MIGPSAAPSLVRPGWAAAGTGSTIGAGLLAVGLLQRCRRCRGLSSVRFVSVLDPFGRFAQLAEGAQRSLLLRWAERLDQPTELPPADHVDLFHRQSAGRRGTDHDDTPVVVVAKAFDQSTLGHPVDDAGQVGQRGAHLFGEVAHRLGAVALEQEKHVEMSGADRAQAAVSCHGTPLARHERLELVEDLLDYGIGGPDGRHRLMSAY